tara:strand:- start:131 stop:310 length:180 start_codon:yes stop_codon:yes gene_type:complete
MINIQFKLDKEGINNSQIAWLEEIFSDIGKSDIRAILNGNQINIGDPNEEIMVKIERVD